ncbi:MAG: hypothetical protein A2599_00810 [Candidatus Staskawiczbacteria bacterium RIFOXYD1_FULL_39_28]|uniref:Uncharacterized protein n=1 Tax=Candidatus Staskawiczbacteria bacterium RIFOXYC1_FULL_38_18 TaxID=1802229 RepID=A0A1G2JCQ1_9BACT|nr:MAG: hypothetical protein A2401_00545 [Candidatus Staskawiczbacteria bacterium RIFOXYC1_FULL_38_18]OGZ91653.1 MAG: hypothetical protein A2599_00810 [Candidatus Staskawiczbacteria bacterium RIFOXYD1_FULL_39_28]
MDFEIKNVKESIVSVARSLGYVIIDTKGNEYNLVRKLDINNYPRFHIYLKQNGTDFNFSLHLDQKKSSYEGSHAHSGEYFGPVVETEADKIKQILVGNNK